MFCPANVGSVAVHKNMTTEDSARPAKRAANNSHAGGDGGGDGDGDGHKNKWQKTDGKKGWSGSTWTDEGKAKWQNSSGGWQNRGWKSKADAAADDKKKAAEDEEKKKAAETAAALEQAKRDIEKAQAEAKEAKEAAERMSALVKSGALLPCTSVSFLHVSLCAESLLSSPFVDVKLVS